MLVCIFYIFLVIIHRQISNQIRCLTAHVSLEYLDFTISHYFKLYLSISYILNGNNRDNLFGKWRVIPPRIFIMLHAFAKFAQNKL